jgi:hypothetical protein
MDNMQSLDGEEKTCIQNSDRETFLKVATRKTKKEMGG